MSQAFNASLDSMDPVNAVFQRTLQNQLELFRVTLLQDMRTCFQEGLHTELHKSNPSSAASACEKSVSAFSMEQEANWEVPDDRISDAPSCQEIGGFADTQARLHLNGFDVEANCEVPDDTGNSPFQTWLGNDDGWEEVYGFADPQAHAVLDVNNTSEPENEPQAQKEKSASRQTTKTSITDHSTFVSSDPSHFLGHERFREHRRLSHVKQWLKRQFSSPPTLEMQNVIDTPMVWIVESTIFKSLSALAVVLNTAYLGYYVDVTVRNQLTRLEGAQGDKPLWTLWILPNILEGCFVLELLLRITAYRTRFFIGKNFAWNLLDFIVVIIPLGWMVQEVAQGVPFKDRRLPGLSILRAWRVFRLVHNFELFRMPFFAELRMMVKSLLESLPSLGWASLLYLITLYMASVWMMFGVAHNLRMYNRAHLNDVSEAEDLGRYFKSLPESMLTMYLVCTNGVDWGQVFDATLHLHFGYRAVFIGYITFVLFAMLNIVSGMFIDRVFQSINNDRDYGILHQQASKRLLDDRLIGLFRTLNLDGGSSLTWMNFQALMQDSHLRSYFAWLGIELSEDVWSLLDEDGDGAITVADFVEGCSNIAGTATAADVKRLERTLEQIERALLELTNISTADPDTRRGRAAMLRNS